MITSIGTWLSIVAIAVALIAVGSYYVYQGQERKHMRRGRDNSRDR